MREPGGTALAPSRDIPRALKDVTNDEKESDGPRRDQTKGSANADRQTRPYGRFRVRVRRALRGRARGAAFWRWRPAWVCASSRSMPCSAKPRRRRRCTRRARGRWWRISSTGSTAPCSCTARRARARHTPCSDLRHRVRRSTASRDETLGIVPRACEEIRAPCAPGDGSRRRRSVGVAGELRRGVRAGRLRLARRRRARGPVARRVAAVRHRRRGRVGQDRARRRTSRASFKVVLCDAAQKRPRGDRHERPLVARARRVLADADANRGDSRDSRRESRRTPPRRIPADALAPVPRWTSARSEKLSKSRGRGRARRGHASLGPSTTRRARG